MQAERRRIITNPAGRTGRSASQSSRRSSTRRPAQRNPGEIVSLVLPGLVQSNPGARKEKRKNMATTAKRRNGAASTGTPKRKTQSNSGASARRKTKKNPAGSHHSRRRVTRRNGSASAARVRLGSLLQGALFTISGAVGSKILTQAVLGEKNKGFAGYAGNGISAFGLSMIAQHVMKNADAAYAILAGGVVQIVLRAITDYTPFGKYTANLGMGDYQASNFVTPQRYVDALNSAEVEIPAGWAPVTQVIAAPASAGMGSLYGQSGLY